MLVSLKEVLRYAEEKGCAVGAFNTTNLECIRAVLDTAEKLNIPVILSHAQVREKAAPLEVIGPVMVLSAKRACVPVAVHLDHCTDLGYMERALRLGFTGVMYDGSLLPYGENVENTRRAVAMAAPLGAGRGKKRLRAGVHRAGAGGPVRPGHRHRRPGPQLWHQPRDLPLRPRIGP